MKKKLFSIRAFLLPFTTTRIRGSLFRAWDLFKIHMFMDRHVVCDCRSQMEDARASRPSDGGIASLENQRITTEFGVSLSLDTHAFIKWLMGISFSWKPDPPKSEGNTVDGQNPAPPYSGATAPCTNSMHQPQKGWRPGVRDYMYMVIVHFVFPCVRLLQGLLGGALLFPQNQRNRCQWGD